MTRLIQSTLMVGFILVSLHVFAQSGNVGINVEDAKATLHVDSTVLFTGNYNTSSPSALPISGPGVRMMWYPDKAAFRVGRISGNQWDNSNIGYSSSAIGENTIAQGAYSMSLGYQTTASGLVSTSFGYNTEATGSYSTAMGRNTTASGIYSTALGRNSIASGSHSTAFGYNSNASGLYSTALGSNTVAYNYSSTVIGEFNDSLKVSSSGASPDLPLFIIGNGNSVNSRSNAMVVRKDGNIGIGTNFPSSKFHLSGGNAEIDRGSEISGLTRWISIEGARNASGNDFVQIRFRNWDEDPDGSATGYTGAMISSQNGDGEDSGDLRFHTTPSAVLSERMIITGTGNIGIGNSSPSQLLSVGDDFGSSLSGNRLTIGNASGVSGINIGEDIDNRAWFLWDATENRAYIGIRSGGIQYNNLLTARNGNIGINTSNPSERFHISAGNMLIDRGSVTNSLTRSITLQGARNNTGNDFAQIKFENLDDNSNVTNYTGAMISSQNYDGSDDGDLRFATYDGTLNTHMTIQPGGNVRIGNNSTSSYKFEVDGDINALGAVRCNGTNICSDIRYKMNIRQINSPLQKLQKIRGVYYEWDSKSHPNKNFTNKTQIGVIAQEVEEVVPEIINTDEDGYKAVDYAKISALLIEAVKEQQNVIKDLKTENERLKLDIELIKETLLRLQSYAETE